MNLILFGPPGAGKGTQASKIIKDFNLVQMSTGELLRQEIKLNTALSKKIKLINKSGKLVSDEIVNPLIEKIVSNPKNFNKIVFDGYPRNIFQAETLYKLLKKFNQKISTVISLNVSKEMIIKRITGRISCLKCFKIFNEFFNPPNPKTHKCDEKYLQKRSDDNLETIIKRFDTYDAETKPVLDYYREKKSFYEIDGHQEIDQIYNKIKTILTNLRD